MEPLRASLKGFWRKRPDPRLLLETLDALLVDDLVGHGYLDVISRELGYEKVKFGRLARLSWFSKTLVLPEISSGQLTRAGLASYAISLSEYLLTLKGARLRWADPIAAINPIAFVQKLQPSAEHLHKLAYQVAGVLDPTVLKSPGPIAKAFRWGFGFLFFARPPIDLFTPDENQAFDYLNKSPVFTGITGRVWQAKAAAHWVSARVLTWMYVSFIVVNLYAAGSMAATYAPIWRMHFDYGHAIHEALKPPPDRDAETREILVELRGDVERLTHDLEMATDDKERVRIQETLDGVYATITQLESTLKPKIIVPPIPTS